jgi:DNA-binding response OmpR family regulator
MTGFEVLDAIRSGGDRVPVIIVSARGEEADKVRGFRLDADQPSPSRSGCSELLERCVPSCDGARAAPARRSRAFPSAG